MTLAALQKQHAREIAALIRSTLRERNGNVLKAAEDLGVSRTTLIGLIAAHGLENETSGKMGRPKVDR